MLKLARKLHAHSVMYANKGKRKGKGYIAVPACGGSLQVTMGFDLQPGSLAAQLFQLHKKYP
eukprot:520864-Pelagomonas_calceolata.AAC.1